MADDAQPTISRRGLLGAGIAASATAAWAGRSLAAEKAPVDFRIQNGRIHQSVMGWCYNPMPGDELARHCKLIGLEAIEGVAPKYYPAAKELGLKISITGSHGFRKGPLDPDNHDYCIGKLRESIDLAADVGCPNAITFTGMRKKGVSEEAAMKNCLQCWKKVIGHAEDKGVTLCLEHLNSRDDTHPMKGHPGYFGDDVELCIDLVKSMDSPRFKLLFDVYHVQVMNGDVIRRIRQYKDYIGHYHTAGNPGRGELDENQEINYPAVMRAIVETGFDGFVAQEFIPTWNDKIAALRHAAMVCDV